jgi:hypothetical protein
MTSPFRVIQGEGVTWVSTDSDRRFRRALMDGVPVPLRAKMKRALAAIPDPKVDLTFSQGYFGDRLQDIADRSKPLVDELDRYMAANRNLPGFRQWMILTGYTNQYLMIEVFDEWSRMKVR